MRLAPLALALLAALAAAVPLTRDRALPLEARAHAVIRAADAAAAARVAAAVGATVARPLALPGHFLAEMHPDMPPHPAVLYVTEGVEVAARVGVRPPVPIPHLGRDAPPPPDWTLGPLNARAAWNVSDGAGALVVVPDTGADWTHPDLARVDGALAANVAEPGGSPMPPDDEYHGTAVASLVVAADNGACGTGVAPGATVAPVRLLATGRPLTSTQKAEALLHAPRAVAAVTNSWGPSDVDPAVVRLDDVLRAAFAELNRRNTVLIFAAGNGQRYGDHMAADGFASSRHTLAVGALGADGRAAPYTESGAVAVAAPSSDDAVGVTAALPHARCTGAFSGTSAAAPQIAGVVALLRPAPGAPPLTPTDVLDVLVHAAAANAHRVAPAEPMARNAAGLYYSPRVGFGVPDAAAAVALAAARTARWVPRDVAAPLALPHPYAPYGSALFEANVTAQGTVVWASATLGLELGDCVLARVSLIALESPAGTYIPVFRRTYIYDAHSVPELEFPTRGFHGEQAAGRWRVHVRHECSPSVLVTGVSRVELQVV